MRLLISFLWILAILVLSGPRDAWAQATGFVAMPQAISVEDVEMASIDFDEAFGMFDNPFLSDVVKLNYQISLLEKMVERQAELQKIQESFGTMGAEFDLPAPPRGICAQLPANAACLKFYPELYPDIVSKRMAYYEELKARIAAANPAAAVLEGESEAEAAARREKEEAVKRERLAKAERKIRYQWTDISCTSNDCRGVLVATHNKGYRATVHEGSRLSDGTLVQEVSPDGIRVVISGDSIRVRPAPSDDASAQGSDADPAKQFMEALGGGNSTLSETAAAVLEGVDNESAGSGSTSGQSTVAATTAAGGGASASAASTGATESGGGSTGGGQTVAEPALGPSGLF